MGIILVVMNKDINKEIVEDSVVITEGPWADKTITISAEIIMEEE